MNGEDFNKEINNPKINLYGKWVDEYPEFFGSMKENLMKNKSRHHYVSMMSRIYVKEGDVLLAEKTVLATIFDDNGDRR